MTGFTHIVLYLPNMFSCFSEFGILFLGLWLHNTRIFLIDRAFPRSNFCLPCPSNLTSPVTIKLPNPSLRPSPAVISNSSERSPAGSDLNEKTRFLASLRNDSGGGIMAFTLREQRDFSLRSTAGKRNDRWWLTSRPSPAVISTSGRDLMQPSSAPNPAGSCARTGRPG